MHIKLCLYRVILSANLVAFFVHFSKPNLPSSSSIVSSKVTTIFSAVSARFFAYDDIL